MSFISRIASKLGSARSSTPQGAQGARAYAIGDVHGRLDLLERMLAKIEADIASAPGARNFIIFLGDLIDRGPRSADVVERLRTYQPDNARVVFLAGNHEEVLLRAMTGDLSVLHAWLRLGGAECVASYGIDPNRLIAVGEAQAVAMLRKHVPKAHVDFLREFADTFRFGDYLFVHAGIRPGIPLEQQQPRDLRWIREPFLGDGHEHGFVVVHGHTVVPDVDERSNRIAIDTGAVHSGVLTAIVIEGAERRYLSTGA